MTSAAPDVRLVNAFARPYENAVATARTCYSGRGIVRTEDVSGTPDMTAEAQDRRDAMRDRIARSTYEAGHHTTLQHAHFQFALSGVSRHFLWTFLHAHPFYNSEQVSQRYVEVKENHVVVPPLGGEARELFLRRLGEQMEEYQALIRLLTPICEQEYFRRFPARAARRERYGKEIQKRAQELARYVLPLATQAYLYHTVSGLTLLRYWRLAETYDAPWEQRAVVGRMVDLLLQHDPALREDPAGAPAARGDAGARLLRGSRSARWGGGGLGWGRRPSRVGRLLRRGSGRPRLPARRLEGAG